MSRLWQLRIREVDKIMVLSGPSGRLDERDWGKREVLQCLPKLGCLPALVQTVIKQKL